ncbi:hypothetical protein LCGC14_0535930 [marine sediment metagenome]|uniref:Uncharacterized protein n=1 Tax=marine sediment metagenome TaxID=412755 RepID=A0A0F9RYU6_9ZZZZ|nr:hypothetical protein [Phycisphaerae bacterium]HDZ43039.1 hypothetical protein [Phycisphaerae bacterium]
MEIAVKVLLGAAVGAAGGLLLGRAGVCSSQACRPRSNLVFTILAGAAFGAAVAWYLINP